LVEFRHQREILPIGDSIACRLGFQSALSVSPPLDDCLPVFLVGMGCVYFMVPQFAL